MKPALLGDDSVLGANSTLVFHSYKLRASSSSSWVRALPGSIGLLRFLNPTASQEQVSIFVSMLRYIQHNH